MIVSFLLGLFLGYWFNNGPTVIPQGGDSNLIKTQTYQLEDGCYKYSVQPVVCPI